MRVPGVIFVTAAVVLADQFSKKLVAAQIAPYSTVSVLPGFDLVHTYNRGVSFGLFASHAAYGPFILSAFALAIVVALAIWACRTESAFQRYSLSAVMGGALGNVIDRLDDGAVTDFLDFYIGPYHWPAFNVADTAIVCGAAALVLETALSPREKEKLQ